MHANPTLEAVAKLCALDATGVGGVAAVVTYNYDNLLEMAIVDRPHQPIWDSQELSGGSLPIYHVHGYVPIHDGQQSCYEDIVFTEEQYHVASQDAYSWFNLVQIQCMSSTTGLMIGLSLSDRNIRRLLDAIMKTPVGTRNYALLKKPPTRTPDRRQLDAIQQSAARYLERFERSGIKRAQMKGPSWEDQVTSIAEAVKAKGLAEEETVLNQLGVTPIWYEDHEEIPQILAQISG